jgi:hypothetical protein
MRVDYHLIQRMLETIEAAPTPEIMFMPELTPDPAAQRHHLQLLIDGGLVTAQQLCPGRQSCALSLTLAGHARLEKLRRKNSAAAQRWMERLLTVSVVRLLFGHG